MLRHKAQSSLFGLGDEKLKTAAWRREAGIVRHCVMLFKQWQQPISSPLSLNVFTFTALSPVLPI